MWSVAFPAIAPPHLKLLTMLWLVSCFSNLYDRPFANYANQTAMGIVHAIDRRSEMRSSSELTVTVWGIDSDGERFLQEAQAREVSLSGALLSGLEVELRSGDLVGILHSGKKARFRIVWVRYSDETRKVQAAVHRVDPDTCPWLESLAAEPLAVE